MGKKRIKIFSMLCLLLSICLIPGCVDKMFKEIQTDKNGAAESSISITQSARIAFIGFSTTKLECNSDLSIQILIVNRDIVRDKFVFVNKGAMAEDFKPISVRSGDQAKIKISYACPDAKYIINYILSKDN
jgi:hypothetical protein